MKHTPPPSRTHASRARIKGAPLKGALSLALAVSLAGIVPASALANEQDAINAWVNDSESKQYAYGSSGGDEPVDTSLPDNFDLREKGVVTPVKFQNPWGTCWGFAAIAAAETSILSELGVTYDQTTSAENPNGLDLSERHLSYFSYASAPEAAGSQEGEGFINPTDNKNAAFNRGGSPLYATTMFSAGIGPLPENLAPYQGEKADGSIWIVCNAKSTSGTDCGAITIREEEYEAKKAEYAKQGITLTKSCYASTYTDDDGNAGVPIDWSLSDELWNLSTFELEESSILPELRVLDENGNYTGYSQEAMNAIKRELVAGRAVSTTYCSDTSTPEDLNNNDFPASYMNFVEKKDGAVYDVDWTHYTAQVADINHAVTIVGWDDDYPAKNFSGLGTDDKKHQPQGNGAWLVKNSWGSDTEDFPNNNSWGNVENGVHTGYFWLSYYDQSISMCETFDFDTDSYGYHDGSTYDEDANAHMFLIDQYNYLLVDNVLALGTEDKASTANVFTAEEDRTVRTLTCETVKPDTTVTYELYLLDSADADPTSGTLAYSYTTDEPYEYGGYHRHIMPEDAWVPMREGQTYAVVVTQYCETDHQYYQSVASNQYTDLEIDENDPQWQQAYEAGWNLTLLTYVTQVYNELAQDYVKNNTEGITSVDEIPADEQEKLNDEAAETVTTEKYYLDLLDQGAQQIANNLIQQQTTSYNAVVNEGESYTCVNGEWTDWTKVTPTLKAENEGVTYDNFPIKAFAEARDWASIDTLSSLLARVEAAEQALANVRVSVNGTDVPAGTLWVTQDAYDALAAAIAHARELLAGAGDNFTTVLLSTTPGQADAEATLTALEQQLAAFNGTAADGSGATDGSLLAKTGDSAHGAATAAAALAALAGAVAITQVSRRRSARRNR
ncbi:MAG: lectin like domain-containing protein [Eggerthellaceae bacterium]|nr:lectin like domain-containing protein [Eggerthellaceae bacterium]